MSADPLVVACPGCGCKLRVPADRRADVGRCPKCQAGFRVDSTGTAVPAGRGIGRRAALIAGAVGGAGLFAAGWWWFDAVPSGSTVADADLADGPPPDDAPTPVPAGEPTRVACVGDSITAGHGLTDPAKKTIPARLAAALGPAYQVKGFAVGGRSVGSAADFPYTDTPEYRHALAFLPHRVILQLGTNDAWPQNFVHLDRLAGDYARLVQSFRRLPTRPRVYACLPPPVFGTITGGLTAERVAGPVTAAVRQAAERLRLPIIDLHTPLAGRSELFPDRLHPNAEGANRIAEVMADAIRADGG